MAQFELNLEALIYPLVSHISHHLFLSQLFFCKLHGTSAGR